MLSNYLKMAWKVLGRRRFFTFVSLFGIGFTLTVVMALAALVDSNLSPGYPENKLDRILTLDRMSMEGDKSLYSSSAGYKFLDRYTRDIPGVESMTAFTKQGSVVTFLDGRKINSDFRYTDAEFWRIMEFAFLEGAPFTEEDDKDGRTVAVIDEGTRRRFFNEEPALGKYIELDGRNFQVVGVVRDVPWYRIISTANIWVPIGAVRDRGILDSLIGNFNGAFLLAPEAVRSEVQAAFSERLTRVELPDPERFHTIKGLPMTRLEAISNQALNLDMGESAPERLLLFGLLAVLAFMALPAINLININLSRIFERSGEIGVRKAFGASSRDLVGQFIVENVVLCLLGGLIGLVGAFVALQILAHLPQIPYMRVSFSGRFFLMALTSALVFGLLSGVGPAWRMSRQQVVDALRGGSS